MAALDGFLWRLHLGRLALFARTTAVSPRVGWLGSPDPALIAQGCHPVSPRHAAPFHRASCETRSGSLRSPCPPQRAPPRRRVVFRGPAEMFHPHHHHGHHGAGRERMDARVDRAEARMHDQSARMDHRAAQRAMRHGDVGRAMALEEAARREHRAARADRMDARTHDARAWGTGGGSYGHHHHHHHRGPGMGVVAAEIGIGMAAGVAMGAFAASSTMDGPTGCGMEVRRSQPPPGFHRAGENTAHYAPTARAVAPPGPLAPPPAPAAYPDRAPPGAAVAPPPTSYPAYPPVSPPPRASASPYPAAAAGSPYSAATGSPYSAAAAAPGPGTSAGSPVTLRVTGVRKCPDGVVRYSVSVRTTLPSLLAACRAHPELATVDVVGGVEVATYVINRRYNDFKTLHEAMTPASRRAGVVLPVLPSGGLGQWLRKDDAVLWAERQGCFARLLAALTASPSLWSHGQLAVWLIPDGS